MAVYWFWLRGRTALDLACVGVPGQNMLAEVSYSLNSFQGGYIGDYIGDYYRGVIKGDTRSLDYSSGEFLGS